MKVPWLSKAEITKKADDLLGQYESKKGAPVRPPVPVEMIAETSLGLQLSFEDLRRQLRTKDILGATYVDLRRISIDNSLTKNEARLSFTCAHEMGHWVLHRDLVHLATRPSPNGKAIFCRTRDAAQPLERQSNYFASCLLMPARAVMGAWIQTFGPEPMAIHRAKSSGIRTPALVEACAENWYQISSEVCSAGGFSNCSKQTMIIRLQELGLLENYSGSPVGWSENNSRFRG